MALDSGSGRDAAPSLLRRSEGPDARHAHGICAQHIRSVKHDVPKTQVPCTMISTGIDFLEKKKRMPESRTAACAARHACSAPAPRCALKGGSLPFRPHAFSVACRMASFALACTDAAERKKHGRGLVALRKTVSDKKDTASGF